MITSLSVKNFALISSLNIEFGEKLNILSGETGAGKSILIDCIMLLTGGRYDKSMLRFGETNGFVEGVFALNEKKSELLEDLADGSDELIITRKFNVDGKNEIRVNGRSATLSMLKNIASELIDLCGQNEHQSLANISNHIKVVDFYARSEVEDIIKEISTLYSSLRKVKNSLEEIGDAKTRARSLDIYKYQLEEIEKVKLKEGEEEELTALRKKFLSSEKICSALSETVNAITENDEGESAIEMLDRAKRQIISLASFDAKYSEWAERLSSAIIEIEDISESASDELDGFDFSPKELEKIEKRLDKIRSITRKYGSYQTVMEYREELVRKIDETENADEYYEKLTKEKNSIVKELFKKSNTLSEIRSKWAQRLEKAVISELSELGMAQSVFEVRFEPLPTLEDCEERLTANGMDKVEFYLSTNAGQPLKPLIKIISGGELSRLMLALKVVSSGDDDIPTVIFDEIDTGISGKVGQEVAKKMARLSQNRQLLCVTHLPQIASMADTHYFISKYTKDNQTYTAVTSLSDEGQIEEIARLSGGKDISAQATENALEMKKWSVNYKKSLA